jgi:uncharacterized LabA/DUF88 family protein
MISERNYGTERRPPYPDRSGRDYFLPGRSVIMIDGSGMHYALRALNADIDYRRLRGLFVDDMRLIRALYYVVTAREEVAGVRRLLDWLDYNGYVVREKLGREFVDANGVRIRRGRISLEMAIDALEMVPLIDHLILFSGDGDLTALVEAVQRKGVRVTAVSTLVTRPPMISTELRRQVDCFIDLRELMPLIAHERQLA